MTTALQAAVKIRMARADDVERIRCIEEEGARLFTKIGMPETAGGVSIPAADWHRYVDCSQVLVATADGFDVPIAFLLFYGLKDSLYLSEIDVHPHYAGRRIGAALIERASAIAARQGRQDLLLSTYRDVPWNAPYYRRLGFVPLPEGNLDESLLEIRRSHIAQGMDESVRVFMKRDVVPSSFGQMAHAGLA